MGKTKVVNVNELSEIFKREFNSDFCNIEGVEVVTKSRSPFNPEYISIGKGRVLSVHIDLGD